MSLRADIEAALKTALKAQDKRKISTLRLVQAALKDRDIALRSKGRSDDMTEPELLELLGRMVRQRQESKIAYEEGGRMDLVKQEEEEIEIIFNFMPKQLDDEEVDEACKDIIKDLQAESLKDMGRVINELKARYPGRIDSTKASKKIREMLSKTPN